MNIKRIISQINNVKYQAGLYLCLCAIGGEGMFCGIESLQALGLATTSMSFWKLTRIYTQRRNEESSNEIDAHNDNLQLLNAALGEVERAQNEFFEFGEKYRLGLGVYRDLEHSFNCYYEGAQIGSARCATKLGTFFQSGKYKSKNEYLALYWFEQGAYLGDAEGAYNLAKYYYEKNDKKYLKRFLFFLNLACQLGNTNAQSWFKSLAVEHPNLSQIVVKINNNKIQDMYAYATKDYLKKYIHKSGVCDPEMIKNAFEILGLDFDATNEKNFNLQKVKKAYHKRIKQLHPDRNLGDNSHIDEINKLTNAYELLLKIEG